MKYFEIVMQSASEKELEKRVRDNEKRGFVLVRYFTREDERTYSINSKYNAADGGVRRMNRSSVNRKFGAVMRRGNRMIAQ